MKRLCHGFLSSLSIFFFFPEWGQRKYLFAKRSHAGCRGSALSFFTGERGFWGGFRGNEEGGLGASLGAGEGDAVGDGDFSGRTEGHKRVCPTSSEKIVFNAADKTSLHPPLPLRLVII